jgi:hypothetical protein
MDELNIRQYARFERLVDAIWIDRNFSSGMVVFGSTNEGSAYQGFYTDHRGGNFIRSFSYHESDKRFVWDVHPQSTSLQLQDLPQNVFKSIMQCVASSFSGVAFNLDARTMQGLDLSSFGIDRLTRQALLGCHYRNNAIEVRMSTQETCTSFSGFRDLRKWLAEPVSQYFIHDSCPRYSLSKSDTVSSFVFKFDLGTVSACHKSLQVEMFEFIRLTWGLDIRTMIHVCIKGTRNGTTYVERTPFKLNLLRQRCFICLSWIITTHSHLPVATVSSNLDERRRLHQPAYISS